MINTVGYATTTQPEVETNNNHHIEQKKPTMTDKFTDITVAAFRSISQIQI